MIEMVFIKYSGEGARGVLQEGLGARRAAVERVVRDFKGTLLGYWATADGEWDTVTIMEFPDRADDAGGVAMNLRGQASGTWERTRRIRLFTAETIDAELRVYAEAAIPWPGQASATT